MRCGWAKIVPVLEVSVFADGQVLDVPGQPGSFTPPAALRSLAALHSLAADTVLPGHDDPWTGGATEAVLLAHAAGPS